MITGVIPAILIPMSESLTSQSGPRLTGEVFADVPRPMAKADREFRDRWINVMDEIAEDPSTKYHEIEYDARQLASVVRKLRRIFKETRYDIVQSGGMLYIRYKLNHPGA